MSSFLSYGVDTNGNTVNLEIRDGVSYVAGTNTRPAVGTTIQTAGGIYQMGSDGHGTLVANHNMIPVEQKGIGATSNNTGSQMATGTWYGTPPTGPVPIQQQAQQNTNTSTGQAVTPAPPLSGSTTGTNAGGLADVVYLPDGSAQQNTLATSGIDNTTIVTGGLVVLVVLLFRWLMGGKK